MNDITYVRKKNNKILSLADIYALDNKKPATYLFHYNLIS